MKLNQLIKILLLGNLFFVFQLNYCQAGKGGYMYFEFLCFNNPGHFDSQGKWCDTFPSKNCDLEFEVCISSLPIGSFISESKCTIYYIKAGPFNNEERVCKGKNDNRGNLATIIKRKLVYPLQEVYYILINVVDNDNVGTHSQIALFGSDVSLLPAPNLGTFSFTNFDLSRRDKNHKNYGTTMNVLIAIQCERNYYGRYCLKYCEALFNSTYTCADNGTKICNEGWIGTNCNQKDLCLYQACAEIASCVMVKNNPICLCKDGSTGSKCYPNFDPCTDHQCQNNGTCIPAQKTSNVRKRRRTHCLCPKPYYGIYCEDALDLCDYNPCQNNGTCLSLPGPSRMCECPEGFSGISCEVYNPLDKGNSSKAEESKYISLFKSKYVIVLIIISLLLLILVVCMLFILLRQRSKRQKKLLNIPQVIMSDLVRKGSNKFKLNSDLRQDSCAYSVNTTTEDMYEIVEDTKRISSVFNNLEDDYLLPYRPDEDTQAYLKLELRSPSLTSSPVKRISSVNIPPPLPSRDITTPSASWKKLCSNG